MRVLASTSAVARILALVLAWPTGSAAAKPTDEQLAAIKANCRSDFMSNCWGVPRGGAEAFQCLKEHLASLSAPCQQAVKAVVASATPPSGSGTAQTAAKPAAETKPAATVAAPVTPSPPATESSTAAGSTSTSAAAPSQSTAHATAEQSAAPTSVKATQGPSASATSSTAKAATKSSAASATVGSQTPGSAGAATAKAKPATTQGTEAAASAATNAAAPPPDLGFIPPRKKLIIARFCHEDFNALCPGVDVGGGRGISCLEANKASLTPDCRDALTRLIR
ncbi:MAG: hypothetical protein ACM3MH_04740 [Actinomycetota bacterium]